MRNSKKSASDKSVENLVTIEKTTNNKKEKKVKFGFYLKKLESQIILKDSQKEYSRKIRENTITFATGPAGVSKTFSACYTLLKLLFENKIEKIIFTKPIKESGENLGFLPGGVDEKLGPYVESFIFNCKEMLGEEIINYLLEQKYIECRPLAYMRGISFNNCGMFLDEAQNTLYSQLALYITRLGNNSKMVIAGDITQRDILQKDVSIMEFINILKGIDGIAFHEFKKEDIVRNKILIEITDRYEKWKESKGL